MGILPDTYVVVSMMRQKKSKKPSGKNKNYCFSSSHSKVVVNSTCPIYNQDIKITAVASGTLVLSVMSQHTLGADTFLGQAELQIEDYHNLSNGDRHHFTLSLSELKIPVYDHFGNVKTLANRTDITGEISFTIDIPPILDNIAGWWFEVVTDLMGNVFDRRIWVLLRGNELLYYDSEFQGTLLGKIDCMDIVKVEEKVYKKTTIPMSGVEITLKDVNTPVLWCYGDDARTLKGIWFRAIERHTHHNS